VGDDARANGTEGRRSEASDRSPRGKKRKEREEPVGHGVEPGSDPDPMPERDRKSQRRDEGGTSVPRLPHLPRTPSITLPTDRTISPTMQRRFDYDRTMLKKLKPQFF